MQMRYFLLLSFLGWMACPVYTQPASGANPFEISSRLPKEAAGIANTGPVNPFNVVAHRTPGISKTLLEETVQPGTSNMRFLQFPEGNTVSAAFIFGFLILNLFFFTFAATANRSALQKAWRSFLSSNALNVAQRESFGFTGSTPYFMLYSSFLLNAGVFVFLITQALNTSKKYNNYGVFAICMGTVIVAFLLKHVSIGFMKWLFPSMGNELSRYNFLIIIFCCVLGFFLIPFDFLIAFAGNKSWQTFVTLWLLGLTMIFIAYGAFRAFSFGTKYLAGYPLHFLLYLCAAEIAPVVLLTKLLT
jgi:hypothetical protein